MNARFAPVGLAIALALASSIVSAQGQGGGQNPPAAGQAQNPPAPPKNLQVLPKDIPREQLTALMRSFRQALGVECSFCHMAEGRGGRNDYAADDKEPKKKARLMIQMVTHVNDMLAAGLGKPAAEVVKVECATCHRGAQIPKVEPPPAPANAPPAAPTPAP